MSDHIFPLDSSSDDDPGISWEDLRKEMDLPLEVQSAIFKRRFKIEPFKTPPVEMPLVEMPPLETFVKMPPLEIQMKDGQHLSGWLDNKASDKKASDKKAGDEKAANGCFITLLITTVLLMAGVAYLVNTFYDKPPKEEDIELDETWNVESFVSAPEGGYLMTKDYLPLRALARKPDVRLYRMPSLENSNVLNHCMRPWVPYYVFDKRPNGWLRIAVTTGGGALGNEEWVPGSDCFCWTTRECASIEVGIPIYRSQRDAELGNDPIESSYSYPFSQNFIRGGPDSDLQGMRPFSMACLPVLRREQSIYWCLVRPEGDENGYKLFWVKWQDASDSTSVKLRFRVGQYEMQEYVIGLKKLILSYEDNVANRDQRKAAIVDYGQRFVLRQEARGKVDLSVLRARGQGIPKLEGYLQKPIESELDLDDVKSRLFKLYQMSTDIDLWDIDDVAYIELARMP